ncbi:MAG: rRNA (uracil1939-C5)-methyltransferase [Alphaproteobacteria bacterium]|nr:rRNA (uracil1939-C5)-methyltransferase [Alphaproteobacteria bacterium]
MTERLAIDRLAHRGDGVAETPAGTLYVPYTLPGETVEVESVPGHPDRRHLLRVEIASPERVEAFCPHFGICGGCAIQHWSPARYREWKRGVVVEALAQAGLVTPVDELIDAHGDGRRRATFHARSGTRGIIEVGFAALRAHHIVAIDRCPVLAPSLDGAIAAAWAIAEALEPQKKPLDIQATATDAGIDMDVRGSGPLNSARMGVMARLAATHKLARLTRHGELIAQRAPPTVMIGRARVALPPGAFLQATAAGEATLARLVQTHVGDAKTVADLFCGVGPFALRLAERARIVAFDADADAIAALKQAANMTSGLKPIEAETRDLFRRPLVAQELKRVDALVFDPPRQGAEAQARELAKSAVAVVIAVSCNPATFARDVRMLADGGYRLKAVTPVDQFRHSAHVEIVGLLTR